MYSIEELAKNFAEYSQSKQFSEHSASLYGPVDYIMSLKAKRIRPLLCLASYNMYKEDISYAFDSAFAIELFHNFSLIHDDLMDDADIRRGNPSVHKKYDDNTAILSGDAMLILSYHLFESYDSEFKDLIQLFNKTALEVCLGQRMDMDFESSDSIEIDDYLKMINLKTSVLIACSLKMGFILAGASSKEAFHIYEFGRNLGIAFQIQDDLLDSFGDAALFGKRIGGDIVQRKKTYLYLKALELLSQKEADDLRSIYKPENTLDDEHRIEKVMAYFRTAHVNVHAQELKLVYQQLAMSHLDAIKLDEEKKQVLRNLASGLLDRQA